MRFCNVLKLGEIDLCFAHDSRSPFGHFQAIEFSINITHTITFFEDQWPVDIRIHTIKCHHHDERIYSVS